MTKEEKLAHEYGKQAAQNGIEYAPCYDSIMRALVSDVRTDRGSRRNQRNMRAWYDGYLEECLSIGGNTAIAAQQSYDRLFGEAAEPEEQNTQGMHMRM